MSPIPIIFIDANITFRQLAVRVFERHFAADIALLADADSWPLLVVPATAPLAVLLGLGSDGLVDSQLLGAIYATLPGVSVIVLGHLDDPPYRTAACRAGAAAFISKAEIGDQLIPTLRRLAASPPRA